MQQIDVKLRKSASALYEIQKPNIKKIIIITIFFIFFFTLFI